MTIKIGVLGGIGPEATIEFYKKLIEGLQQKNMITKNSDYPQLIINSIPAPELLSKTLSNDELYLYEEGLLLLDKNNVDFIIMVCNTIHLFLEDLQKKIKTPILDLREKVNVKLEKEQIHKITVLGTPLSINNNLYCHKKAVILNPTLKELDILSKAIENFNKGNEKEKQIEIVREMGLKYLKEGSEIIILGCTELAVMLQNEQLPVLNTIDILVDSVIEEIIKYKLENK